MGFSQQYMGFPQQDMGFPQQDMDFPEQIMGFPHQDVGFPQQDMGFFQQKDVPFEEFMYCVFTITPCGSSRRRLGSLLCPCDVFPALINRLTCWQSKAGFPFRVPCFSLHKWDSCPADYSVLSRDPVQRDTGFPSL